MTTDLLTAVAHWAAATPGQPAHESEGRRVTYRELAVAANDVAALITNQKLDPAVPILVRGHKEPEMLIGFLGCLLAGHPYVPVDVAVPWERVNRIIDLAGAKLVLTPAEIAAAPRPVNRVPPRTSRSDAVQYVMFTSGSTGQPKGVPITRANLDQFARWMLDEQRFTPSHERFLDQAVYSFDLSVMSVYLGLIAGGALVTVTAADVSDPRRLFRTLASSRATVWVSTPTFAQMCLAERRFDATMLPDIHRFLFCGETLAAETARSLLDRFPAAEVWNTYGPTETTVATTSVRVDRTIIERYSPLPVGRPAPRSRVAVVDHHLVPVAEGERGEILIAGPQVSPGYLHAPELTEGAFVDWNGQWAYRSGDRGHVRDGFLFFDGRADGQIKLHGYRVELGDVEAHLRSLPGVVGAAVVVVSRNGVPDHLAGFVVLDSDSGNQSADIGPGLKAQLAEQLPAYMLPRTIRCLDALPMTANGKLDRRALPELIR